MSKRRRDKNTNTRRISHILFGIRHDVQGIRRDYNINDESLKAGKHILPKNSVWQMSCIRASLIIRPINRSPQSLRFTDNIS